MIAGWWRCGECRSTHGPEVEHCPCLDEAEEQPEPMSRGEQEEEAMWEAADRALAEMENR